MTDQARHHDTPGYERRDAPAWATVRAGLYMLGVMFLTAAVLVPAYRFLGRREKAAQEPAATVLGRAARAPEPAFPRLVTSEPAALAAFRAQEDALLTSYGWVEKDRGIARMPIAEAMKIVAERGLPSFAPPPAAATGTQAPPAPQATSAPQGGGR